MSWILDIAFFAIILLGILLGVRQGFIAGVCKIAGTIFAVAVAVLFCNGFAEGIGLTEALANAVGNAKLGGWLAVAIAFILLLVITKLSAWLLGKLGTALADRISAFNLVNRLCGGVLGLAKALVFIFLLLAASYWLINWLNLSEFEAFINGSGVVGAIFRWDGFVELAHFRFLFPSNN